MTSSGKSTLIDQIQRNDLDKKFLFDCGINLDLWDYNDKSKDYVIKNLNSSINENCNIYVDDIHPYLKKIIIDEYIKKEPKKSKIIVTVQSINDLQDMSLFEKFEMTVAGKTNEIETILLETKLPYNPEKLLDLKPGTFLIN